MIRYPKGCKPMIDKARYNNNALTSSANSDADGQKRVTIFKTNIYKSKTMTIKLGRIIQLKKIDICFGISYTNRVNLFVSHAKCIPILKSNNVKHWTF